MRPEARVAAAIDILDDILAGAVAERCLTGWARNHRFAGSGDRAAIRDLVFDVLRKMRSCAWVGGSMTGRGLVLGALRMQGQDPGQFFTGEGHAPAALTDVEASAGRALTEAPDAVRLDCPDWLLPRFEEEYGAEADPVLSILRSRAPVFLRVNLARVSREDAITSLSAEGIGVQPHPLAGSALEVTSNERRVRMSQAYLDGLVELQDAASQAVVQTCLPFARDRAVLDYCAGGGGKALAFAGAGIVDVTAHDAAQDRMKDLPARARRAGAEIRIVRSVEDQFGLVLCDAPCSGSGAWRRQPEAKWSLDQARLDTLNSTQDEILATARDHVAPGGVLAYATCSLIRCENDDRIASFLERFPGWNCLERRQWVPNDGGDGFFLAILKMD